MYNVNIKLYTLHCTLYTVISTHRHCTLYTMDSDHCTLYTTVTALAATVHYHSHGWRRSRHWGQQDVTDVTERMTSWCHWNYDIKMSLKSLKGWISGDHSAWRDHGKAEGGGCKRHKLGSLYLCITSSLYLCIYISLYLCISVPLYLYIPILTFIAVLPTGVWGKYL